MPRTTKARGRSALITTQLDDLASRFVGDSQGINHYFVCVQGHVVTVSDDFDVAYQHWRKLAREHPNTESTLEDRHNGTLASVEPISDEPFARLVTKDDTAMMQDAYGRRLRI